LKGLDSLSPNMVKVQYVSGQDELYPSAMPVATTADLKLQGQYMGFTRAQLEDIAQQSGLTLDPTKAHAILRIYDKDGSITGITVTPQTAADVVYLDVAGWGKYGSTGADGLVLVANMTAPEWPGATRTMSITSSGGTEELEFRVSAGLVSYFFGVQLAWST